MAAPLYAATWSVGPPMGVVPAGSAAAGGHRAAGHCSYGRCAAGDRPCERRAVGDCPYRGPWPHPTAPLRVAKLWPTALQGACPWPATLAEGLVVVGHPLSSLLLL
ncbi:hypothetical protein GW17_00059917 [Ensete ventricosum]|nr:hypothetical protein GW17_00059917 [Ensete ventricosum]RZS22861.1 hypothetical protein BHM03_00055691 [Ensete ventricosum]